MIEFAAGARRLIVFLFLAGCCVNWLAPPVCAQADGAGLGTASGGLSSESAQVLKQVQQQQLAFAAKQGRWAFNWEELGWKPEDPQLHDRIWFWVTKGASHATLDVPAGEIAGKRWRVGGDGKVEELSNAVKLEEALTRAGEARGRWEAALRQVAPAQRESLEFLLINMPDRDLEKLSAEYLLENIRLAHLGHERSRWRDQIPQEVFLNYVLPYANINERRDDWRAKFIEQFRPIVEGSDSISAAAVKLNQQVFPQVKVKYSTQRKRADQSPLESIGSGLASCTGLSVLLIDACRSQGIPARFVGTPLWSDDSGNHSWVEIWDGDWKFTGAAEPSGDALNQGWFVGRAATAKADDPRYAIYAACFQRTPIHFPLVWDRRNKEIPAINVTARYLKLAEPLPEGYLPGRFSVRSANSGERIAVSLRVLDASGKVLVEGLTKDEAYDTNDYLSAPLKSGDRYRVEFLDGVEPASVEIEAAEGNSPWVWKREVPAKPEKMDGEAKAVLAAGPWSEWLAKPASERPPLVEQAWARESLSRDEAVRLREAFWADHVQRIRAERAEEMEAKVLQRGEQKMPFAYKVFGEKPDAGRSLYISMHGGGGAPPRVNNQQWENQKRLYKVDEGVYLAPRAPTDSWDLWHQATIDPFFDRLIENLIVFEDVDPNKIYILGYSAGGDGVYQLAPRLADRWAAAAMMAGHPNETVPLGLRNVPFALQVGAEDAAYRRNEIGREWGEKLKALREADPDGYENFVRIREGKGHWMDLEDAEALPWMAKFRRNPWPEKIVWKQDDVVRNQFYWLEVDPAKIDGGALVRASRKGQRIDLETEGVREVRLLLRDEFIDLDQPVEVYWGGKQVFSGKVSRTAIVQGETLGRRGDLRLVFSARVAVALPGETK
jgi:predicted esterase